MFTGIITHTGKVQKVTKNSITVVVPKTLCAKIKKGDSVSMNGVCLTVCQIQRPSKITANIMEETQRATCLGELKKSDTVNLELPTTASSLFSGHLVLGHVDGIATLKKIEKNKNSLIYNFSTTKNLLSYIVPKGSICIDGASLTIIKKSESSFSVGIIPHTLKITNLKNKKIGDSVNIETDIIAKYVKLFLKK